MSDEQSKKDECLRILTDVKTESKRLEAMGQTMIQAARLSQDIAAPVIEMITQRPCDSLDSEQLDRGIASWRDLKEATSQMRAIGPALVNYSAAASGAINTTTSLVITCGS